MNHQAIIVKIDKVAPIPNADRIQTAYVLGEQVVVSKDWQVGQVGVFFPAELQLSKEFCSFNNLYRQSGLNQDKDKTGFFDANRRVRCQPFLKVRSEGFFCELSSLRFCGEDIHMGLKVGDKFDTLNGKEVCKKYISEKTLKAMNNVQNKKTKVVETPMFHKHVTTDQFKYHTDHIPAGALISIHHKVHGTSGRYSYSQVMRVPKTVTDKVKDFFGMFPRQQYEYLVGTRNVVLYEDQYDKEGFHGSEQYRFDVLEQLKPHLEKGMTIYGELAGYANGKPIMGVHSTEILKDKAFNKKYGKEMLYKYGCTEEATRFHVYRISVTNEQGTELDYTDAQVMDWCDKHGFNSPLALCEPFIYDGSPNAKEDLIELVEELTERPEQLCEDYIDPSHISEGVIIRVDHKSTVPKFYKNKSYPFKCLEGIFKENSVDTEDAS